MKVVQFLLVWLLPIGSVLGTNTIRRQTTTTTETYHQAKERQRRQLVQLQQAMKQDQAVNLANMPFPDVARRYLQSFGQACDASLENMNSQFVGLQQSVQNEMTDGIVTFMTDILAGGGDGTDGDQILPLGDLIVPDGSQFETQCQELGYQVFNYNVGVDCTITDETEDTALLGTLLNTDTTTTPQVTPTTNTEDNPLGLGDLGPLLATLLGPNSPLPALLGDSFTFQLDDFGVCLDPSVCDSATVGALAGLQANLALIVAQAALAEQARQQEDIGNNGQLPLSCSVAVEYVGPVTPDPTPAADGGGGDTTNDPDRFANIQTQSSAPGHLMSRSTNTALLSTVVLGVAALVM